MSKDNCLQLFNWPTHLCYFFTCPCLMWCTTPFSLVLVCVFIEFCVWLSLYPCDGVSMSVCLFMCLSFLPRNILPLFHTLTTGGYFRPVMVHSTTAFMFRQEFHTWGRKGNNCLCCDCVTATLLESKYRERIHITNISSRHTWYLSQPSQPLVV